MFRTRAIVVAFAAAMTLTTALAGCGSGGGGGQAASSSSATPDAQRIASLYRQLAQCVRAHGVPNFPDPVQDPSGNWTLPDGTAKPPRSALDACQSIADQLPSKGDDHKPVSAAEMAKLRRFAQCMRQHGVPDWPDPNPDGAFPLPARYTRPGGKRLVVRQMQACKQYQVGRSIRVAGPQDGGHG